MPAQPKKKLTLDKAKKDFIGRHIAYKDINWPREMKIMRQLVESMSKEPEFWMFAEAPFPMVTLAWYLTPKGQSHLLIQKKLFKFRLEDKKEEVKIDKYTESFDNRSRVSSKSSDKKNVKEFLKLW